MTDITDGKSVTVSGSGTKNYTLKNVGGVYSCNCPAWNFQSLPIELRTCKHLKAYRGTAVEEARVIEAAGGEAVENVPSRRAATRSSSTTLANTNENSSRPPQLLLAHKWEEGMAVDNWWVSEKLDGVRAYWDGENFISRQGNYFLAPDWFVEKLPKVPLDGELWGGRQNFQSTVSITRRQDRGGNWNEILYIVFDAPAIEKPFEERMQYLKETFAACQPTYGAVAKHHICTGPDSLQQELARVESLGGEGLMLRQPRSLYASGRSATLLKVKNFHDAEAKVTGHVPGAGKHEGRLGALQTVLPNGTAFLVGTGFSDMQREDPPAINSIITFRYQELTKAGVPRFPSYIGDRTDLAWEQVSWPPPGVKTFTANNDPMHAPIADLEDVSTQETDPVDPGNTNQEPVEDVYSYLEYAGSKSIRYWEVKQQQNQLYITHGRKGKTSKQEQPLTFPTPAIAARYASNETQAKLDKGYMQPGQTDNVSTAHTQQSDQDTASRYFEFQGGKNIRFWEIELVGDRINERYGKIDGDSKFKDQQFGSVAEAEKESKKRIQQKVDKGYIEGGIINAATQASSANANLELEKLILKDLDDEVAYLIYSDWLQTQGNARGDLIALFCADREHDAHGLIESCSDQFLGNMAEYVDEDILQLTWSKGYIKSAALRIDYEAAEQGVDAQVVLRSLVRHPSSKFIQEIILGYIYSDEVNYQDAIDVLIEAGQRLSVKSLFIGDFAMVDDTEVSWSHLGNCAQLWPLYPNLEKVILQSGSMTLGNIRLPALKSFEVRTGGLDRHCIESINKAHWPKIESLTIWFGAEDYGSEGSIDDLQDIFSGKNLTHLTHLGLMNCEFTDQICEAIGQTTIAKQLQTLDLSKGTMTDEGAHALARHKDVFSNLRQLNIDSNYLSNEGTEALSQFCAQVSNRHQQDADEWGAYVSVGE